MWLLVLAFVLTGCVELVGLTGPALEPEADQRVTGAEVVYHSRASAVLVVQRYEGLSRKEIKDLYFEANALRCVTRDWPDEGVMDLWTWDSLACYDTIIAPHLKRGVGKWVVVPVSEGNYLGWHLAPMAPTYVDGSPGGADFETGRFDFARVWIEAEEKECAPELVDEYRFFLTEECSMKHPWKD